MLPVQQLGAILLAGSPLGEKLSWVWPPYIIVPLLALAILYVHGTVRLSRRTSRVNVLQVTSFALGWLSLLIALDSPMHELSEQLFWVHMSQHEILMLVSAPLLVLSRPLVPLLFAFSEK